jgi:FMN-dependent oxidoreductase (nitrilotriacetate monooxygenase family)
MIMESCVANHMPLAVLIQGAGTHPASWRATGHPRDPAADIDFYVQAAKIAEKGCLDLFFIADTPAARTENLEAWSRFPMFMNGLEPVTLLSAVAAATTHIGLGATASTSFYEPFNVARLFASLDQISHGRAGWNVVTSANDYAARNFGYATLPPHAERYERAYEFVDVVKKLWDTWEEDAFIYDLVNGQNFDPAKFHMVRHDGKHFRVHGGLNIRRSPQGRPVLIQAGSSETGKDFAAETAEVVFTSNETVEAGRAFYKDLKSRMLRFGRQPSELKVLAGLPIIVGSSTQEAEDKYQTLQSLIHPMVGCVRLGTDLETNLLDLPLDEPIPMDRVPAKSNFHQSYFEQIVALIKQGLTLRQIYMRYERGLATLRGTPVEVADRMQAWVEAEAADGFMLLFPVVPGGLKDFTTLVVPELQRRGLMRQAYTETTLRGHLGLATPVNRHVAARAQAAE